MIKVDLIQGYSAPSNVTKIGNNVTFISKTLPNKYTSLLASWLVWHVMANAGAWYPPFSPEALLFDIRFLLSGLTVVVLYDIVSRANIKLLDKHV